MNTGGNSGYQVLNLLYFLGAKKIILLGYDMKMKGNLSHWHGDHPNELNRFSNYKDWCQKFNQLAQDLKDEGVKVINATRETALNCFDRLSLEEALWA